MERVSFILCLCFVTATAAFAQDGPTKATMSVPDIAEQSVQGVVNISTTQRMDKRFNQDPLFKWFYGRGMPPSRRGNSLGSGVLVSADGLILTNNHVVADADTIKVNLADGRELSAKVVGLDPKSDVAVIQIEKAPRDLRPIAIGSSDALRLGETVLAIGNPFGLGHTVTMGIVSAKGRANLDITDYEDFIQTDAAINPGNSGGALVNQRGELVGINTAIFSRSGGYQGIGFAIPVQMAASIMKSLVDKGRVDRGYLGVGIQPLSKSLARRFQLAANQRGVLINAVGPGTPAEGAGIEAGDIVLSMDGVVMTSPDVLRNAVALKGAGTKVALQLWRNGEERAMPIILGLLPDERKASRPAPKKPKSSGQRAFAKLGLELTTLDTQLRRRLGMEPDVNGLAVLDVMPGSRAASVGLRRGDVILKVNRKRVQSTRDFERAVERGQRETLLRIRRGSARLFVVL